MMGALLAKVKLFLQVEYGAVATVVADSATSL
jgi:hypothetical protein